MSAADVTPEEIKVLRERFRPFQCDMQTSRYVRRILDALEDAQAELSRLRSAPVAVEVPEPTFEDQAKACEDSQAIEYPEVCGFNEGFVACKQWYIERLHPIDPSRVLKEGERAVDRAFLDRVAKLVPLVCDEWPTSSDEFKLACSVECDLDALRSGEAEGRRR